MDAGPDEVVLTWHPEPPVRRAQGQQDGGRTVLAPVAGAHAAVVAVDVQGGDGLGGEDLDAEPLGLPAQPVGEVRTGDALGEAGEVVEPLGDAGLTADPGALDHQGAQALAGGVEGGCQPGGA